MNLVCVVHVELEILPTTVSGFRGRDLGVIKEHGVSEQKVANTVPGLLTASLNRRLLIAAARADTRLVLVVVTKQSADLQIVRSKNQREVIFPNVEIFAIGPWRLVPDVRVTTC